jgi:GSCFA family
MSHHPYRSLPPHCFWRRTIAEVAADAVDPVVTAKFKVGRRDKVATAGSCFAQHIARHLHSTGFNYFVTEEAPPLFSEELVQAYNYRTFTARYGNVYTSRQLLQLLQRAYGLFSPGEDIWQAADGNVVDAFRPQIQPTGFASATELAADRAQHLAAVRRAVEELDVLVFTLGLTEAWLSRIDGAVYPICPGVAGGDFDDTRHEFKNLGVAEVIADMTGAIDFVRGKNPAAKFILTVSPVPLAATAENRSVLVSTTYSKSVLRVAAEELARDRPYVAYFPSYEIITGSYTRGAYFAQNLRDVTDAGVAHVMRLFLKHYASDADVDLLPAGDAAAASDDTAAARARAVEKITDVICEEEILASADR